MERENGARTPGLGTGGTLASWVLAAGVEVESDCRVKHVQRVKVEELVAEGRMQRGPQQQRGEKAMLRGKGQLRAHGTLSGGTAALRQRQHSPPSFYPLLPCAPGSQDKALGPGA